MPVNSLQFICTSVAQIELKVMDKSPDGTEEKFKGQFQVFLSLAYIVLLKSRAQQNCERIRITRRSGVGEKRLNQFSCFNRIATIAEWIQGLW